MKNIAIVVLAILSAFMTWKAYFSDKEVEQIPDAPLTLEDGKIDYFKGVYDNAMGIGIYDVVENFRNHTLKSVSDRDTTDLRRDRTDKLVTKSVSFEKDSLLKLLNASTSSEVKFHFASLDRLSAGKYVNYQNMKIPDPRNKIKKSQVVQKPILILEIDTVGLGLTTTKVFAIGKICPPPNSCP